MGVSNALAVQGRVIWALMLREIHTIYGHTRLGYLWVVVHNAFGIAVFWGLRAMMKAGAPHGMSMPAYLIAGFSLWNVFSGIISKSIVAESANRSLLSFPQITVLDSMVARTAVLLATETLVAAFLLALSKFWGYTLEGIDWEIVLYVLFLLPTLSLGLGMILASLNIFLPAIERLVPIVLRIMFFLCGIFFSADMLVPYAWRDAFRLNPVLQFIDWLRAGLAPSYTGTPVSPDYLVCLTLVFLTAGLILERYVRKYAGRML